VNADDLQLSNQKLFTDFMVDGVKCGPDGARCEVDGNLWCSSNAGCAVGYNGVTVWTAEGKVIGRIRLPEVTPMCVSAPNGTGCSWRLANPCPVHVDTQGTTPS
jgi:gluconolactonase